MWSASSSATIWWPWTRRRRAAMSIDPRKIQYLEHAAKFLGNVEYEQIAQIGESLSSCESSSG